MAKQVSETGTGEVQISETEYKKLRKRIASAKGQMDEARGTIGQIYQTAEEKHGLNKWADKVASNLDSRDPATLTARYQALMLYFGYLGIPERANANLFEEAEAEEEEVEAEDSNVEDLRPRHLRQRRAASTDDIDAA